MISVWPGALYPSLGAESLQFFPRPPLDTMAEAATIPKKIFQTWKSKDLTPALQALQSTWTSNNPDYEYQLYDDAECAALIAEHFSSDVLTAFRRLRAGAFKADLWRLCALYVHGGVYADLDTICMNALDPYLDGATFVSVIDLNTNPREGCHNVFNTFIASVPHHPILKDAIDRIVHQVSNNIVPRSLLDVCGPGVLGRAVNTFFGRGEINCVTSLHGDHANGVRLLYFEPGTGFVRFQDAARAPPILQNKNGNPMIFSTFCEAYTKYEIVGWVSYEHPYTAI